MSGCTGPVFSPLGLAALCALALLGCLGKPTPFDCSADPTHSACVLDGSGPDGAGSHEMADVGPADSRPPRRDDDASVIDAGIRPLPDSAPNAPDAEPVSPPDAAPMPPPDAEPLAAPDAAPAPERGCGGEDARCPPERPICLGDRCARCDALDHRGCDVESARPWCDADREACVGCGRADSRCLDPGRSQCVEGVCRACDPATSDGCDAERPVCADDGQGLACRACEADDECYGAGLGAACVDGACVLCDPADHTGCGPDALCCEGPDGPACRPTDPANGCADCGVGCGLAGDACVARQCVCGAGLSCEDDGHPYCVDGDCAACAVDGDAGCEGARGQCVAGVCRACDPADHAGCTPGRPLCEPDLAVCVACEQHADCGHFAETPFCVEGRCVPCEPGTDLGCVPDQEACIPSARGAQCVSAACTDDWIDIPPEGATEFHFETHLPRAGLWWNGSYRWRSCNGGGPTSVARLVLLRPARVAVDVLEADYNAVVELRHGCDDGVTVPPGQWCRWDPGPDTPEQSHGVLQPGVYFVLLGGLSVRDLPGDDLEQFFRGTGRARVTVSEP